MCAKHVLFEQSEATAAVMVEQTNCSNTIAEHKLLYDDSGGGANSSTSIIPGHDLNAQELDIIDLMKQKIGLYMHQESGSDTQSDVDMSDGESESQTDAAEEQSNRSRTKVKEHFLPEKQSAVVGSMGGRQRKAIADRAMKFRASRSPAREDIPDGLSILKTEESVQNVTLINTDLDNEERRQLESNITVSRRKWNKDKIDLSFLDFLPESNVDDCIRVKDHVNVSSDSSLDSIDGGVQRNIENDVGEITSKVMEDVDAGSIQSIDIGSVSSYTSNVTNLQQSDDSEMCQSSHDGCARDLEIRSNTSDSHSAFKMYETEDLDHSFDIGGLHSEQILAEYARRANVSLYDDLKNTPLRKVSIELEKDADDINVLSNTAINVDTENNILEENNDHNMSYTKTDHVMEQNKTTHTIKIKRQSSLESDLMLGVQQAENVEMLDGITDGLKCLSMKVASRNKTHSESSCDVGELEGNKTFIYSTTEMQTKKEETTSVLLPYRESLEHSTECEHAEENNARGSVDFSANTESLDLIKQQPRCTSSPLLSSQRHLLLMESPFSAHSNETIPGSSGFEDDVDTVPSDDVDDTDSLERRSSWESNRTFTITESEQSSSSPILHSVERTPEKVTTKKVKRTKVEVNRKETGDCMGGSPNVRVPLRVKRHSNAARKAKAKSWHASSSPARHPDEDCFFISYGKEEIVMVTPDGKTRSLREYSPDTYSDSALSRSTPEITKLKDVVPDERRYPKFVRMDEIEVKSNEELTGQEKKLPALRTRSLMPVNVSERKEQTGNDGESNERASNDECTTEENTSTQNKNMTRKQLLKKLKRENASKPEAPDVIWM